MLVKYLLEKRLYLRCFAATLIVLFLVHLLTPFSKPIPSHVKDHEDGIHVGTTPTNQSSKASTESQALIAITPPSTTLSEETPLNKAPESQPALQIDSSRNPQLHVVIAHYEEDPYYVKVWTDNLRSIPYVQELGLKIIIYTKHPTTDLATLKDTSGAEEVIRLPNVGREGGTYLHHLLNVYEDPPQYIMFTQGVLRHAQQVGSGPHAGQLQDWLQQRLGTEFGNDTGFMSLDKIHAICYCGHCTDMGRSDFYPLWPQIYTLLENNVCQELEGHVLSFNGHFIVSRRRISARPRWIYEYLQGLIDAPEDHWIHAEPQPKWFEKEHGRSTPGNPKFGHTLERLWHTLFGCDDPTEMTDCDLKGMNAEGPGGCTCKDFPVANLVEAHG